MLTCPSLRFDAIFCSTLCSLNASFPLTLLILFKTFLACCFALSTSSRSGFKELLSLIGRDWESTFRSSKNSENMGYSMRVKGKRN